MNKELLQNYMYFQSEKSQLSIKRSVHNRTPFLYFNLIV